MKRTFLYIILFLSFAACEKQTDWNLDTERNDLIVVDGMITNEMKAHAIRLTYPVENLNDVPMPVSGATVTISDDDSVYTLTEQPVNSGIYITANNFIAQTGKEYTLHITQSGTTFTAVTHLLPGINFNQLQIRKNEENELYHITYIASPFNPKDFAIWEIFLDWSNVTGYQDMDPDSCKARILFYTLPTIDVGQVFSPAIEKISFPLNTIITERRYSITAEHAEYIRAMLSETNWTGGFFDSAHSNVPTNMSEGAIGFFSACGVEQISQTAEPQK